MPANAIKTVMFSNDMVTCLMLKKELEAADISFIAFPTLKNALNHVTENKPDIVITDLYSQGKKGWELVETIRDNQETEKPKVIVFTANPDKVTADLRSLNKIVAVIEKPVLDAALFIEAIHKICK